MLAGLMLGYGMTTLLESTLHRVIYHAGPRTRRFWARYPRISGPFRRAYFSHGIVHHRWTFRKNFVTQFASRQEQEQLDQRFRSAQALLIRREHYGVTLGGVGIAWFNLPILPGLLLIGLVLGPWGFVGALPAVVAYSCLATFVHPFLHRPHQEAMVGASPVLRWVLKTGYVQFLRRHHYLHHRYTDCNFNLLLGGDVVLGRYRPPTVQDWDEMRRLGLVGDDGRRRMSSTLIRRGS
jgi:sterol desaturase/sphingolipid hydroxylase (fatty acid hydroxylase superfamily)